MSRVQNLLGLKMARSSSSSSNSHSSPTLTICRAKLCSLLTYLVTLSSNIMISHLTKFKSSINSSSSSSSSSSSAYQFIQKCCVSRTAKGKAKIKAGQTLKRSKITTKKSGDSSAAVGGGRNFRERQERENLYDQCLNAPTPIRYLPPKQRAREAEREKMGLISKERQREIDMLKPKNYEKFRVSEKPMTVGTPGLDLVTLGLVDVEEVPRYELNVEDGRRLAKEYSRVLMRKHRERQAKESMLLKLKKEAIEALPESLKEAALVPDLTPFPVNRFMATLTPPIEGYIEKVREAALKSSGNEKIR